MLLHTFQSAMLQICAGRFILQNFILSTFSYISSPISVNISFVPPWAKIHYYLSVALCLSPMKWVSDVNPIHGLFLRKTTARTDSVADNSLRRAKELKSNTI